MLEDVSVRGMISPTEYRSMYAASIADPDGLLGRARASGSTG